MSVPVLRWDVPGPVRGRLLDAGRRRQRRPVRVAQPRPPDRRRASSAWTRTAAASAPRSAPTSERPDARLPDALHGRQPRRSRLPRRSGRRALDGRARRCRCSPSAPTALPDRHGPHERRRACAGRRCTPAGGACSTGSSTAAAADPGRRSRGSRRADDRPVLLRGGRRGGEPLPSPLRRRHRQRPHPRPLDRGRAGGPRCRSEHRRSPRPLHALPGRSLLQRAPHRPAARDTRRPWTCPLSRSRRGSPASATRSAPTSRSSRRRSTSLSTTWPHWPRPESTSWARTAHRTSRPSTQPTATRSAGTSSAICRAARRRS